MRKVAIGSGNAKSLGGTRAVLMGGVLCGLLIVGMCASAQDKDKNGDKSGINVTIQGKDTDAGLVIKTQATAKEVGLPLYPGSRPSKEDGDGSAAANLGLWGNTFGFKLVVMKMESSDSPDRVAAYYQKALGKYGKVLDCTNNPAGSDDKEKKSHELTCQDDRPDAGGRMFKAGTKEKQHIVGVKPGGKGCMFQLIYIEARDDDNKTPA